MDVNFGDIFYADLGNNVGSEQGGVRPVVCVQCRALNETSPTVVVIPITSKAKPTLLTHAYIPKGTGGLIHDSCVMAEQIRTIDKSRLKKYAYLLYRRHNQMHTFSPERQTEKTQSKKVKGAIRRFARWND